MALSEAQQLAAQQKSYMAILAELTANSRELNKIIQTGSKKDLYEFYAQSNKAAIQYNSLATSLQGAAQTLDKFRSATQAGKMLYLGQALSSTGRSLTDLRDKIYALQNQLGTTFATAVDSGTAAFTNQITSLFTAGPALSFRDSIDAINAFQKEFGTLLTRGAAADIAKGAKQFGTDINTFVKAQRTFLGAGGLVNQAKLQQQFITQFRAAGLTANQALAFAADNANLTAIAGVKYADSLARAAANATKIGVSLEKTTSFFDGIVDDFEGGLERAAELRAMGFEYDFNEIARIAGTGTEEERQAGVINLFKQNRALLEDVQRNAFLRRSIEKDTGFNIAEALRLAKGGEALPGEETKPEEREGGFLAGLTKVIGPFAKVGGILATAMGFQTMATIGNTMALMKSTGASMAQALGPKAGGGGLTGLGTAAKGLGIAGGIAGVSMGSYGAYQSMKAGDKGGAFANVLMSTLSGAGAGAMFGPYGAAIGGLIGLGSGLIGMAAANDIAMGPGKGRVILGPEGAFKLNAKDSILAGTKLLGSGAEIGMNAMEAQTTFSLLRQNIGQRFFLGKNPLLANPYANAAVGTGTALLQGQGVKRASMIGGGTLAGGLAGQAIGAGLGRLVGGAMGSVLGPIGTIAGGALGSYLVGKMLQPKEALAQPTPASAQAQPQSTNVNVNMTNLETKLDKLASAFSGMKIEMDGNTVGRVSLNARSPLDRLSVVG
jgi:hypothetical protein